jgi:hypothetical protein
MKKLAPEERIRARLRELANQAGKARRELQQLIDMRRLIDSANDRPRWARAVCAPSGRVSQPASDAPREPDERSRGDEDDWTSATRGRRRATKKR